MTSSPATPGSLRPLEWLAPDGLTDDSDQFAVEWQVVDGTPPFPFPTDGGEERIVLK